MPSVLNKADLNRFLSEKYDAMVKAAIALSIAPGNDKRGDFKFRLTYDELKLGTQRARLRKETLDHILAYLRSCRVRLNHNSEHGVIVITINLITCSMTADSARALNTAWGYPNELRRL
jgi:hypothetical protein